jgi:Ni,Fe-hydrogenase III small subunit
MSKSMFRMALEGEQIDVTPTRPNEPTIVMSGPLSEVFTKALDVAYAKAPQEGAAVIAQESAAQDVTIMQKIVESINNNQQQATQPVDTAGAAPAGEGADLQVYGVAKSDIQDSDVVDVADALMNEDETTRPKEFVVVVDSTIPGANGMGSAPQEEVEYLSEAMESLTKRLGGKFYRSFEEFVEARVNPETDLQGSDNDGADGVGSAGCVDGQQGGEGKEGDPATQPDPKDPSITAAVVNIAKIAREEAATPPAEGGEATDGQPPAGDNTGVAPALENGRDNSKNMPKPIRPYNGVATENEDGNSDTGQPVVQPVQGLPNDPGALSPEAAAAIGAGGDKVPLPKKEGEVDPNLTVGGDPTEPIAGSSSLESYTVRVVTLSPRQRVRARR